MRNRLFNTGLPVLLYTAAFTIALTVAQTSYAATSYAAACTDPSSDQDGDDWGWENHASCIITSDTAAANNNKATSSPTAAHTTTTSGNSDTASARSNRYPACSSTEADEDGDGWGYENNATCIVNEQTSEAGSVQQTTQTTATNTASDQQHPICQSLDSDPDGDAWGYENSASCQVNAQTGTAAATAGTSTSAGNSGGGGGVTGQATGLLLDQKFESASIGLYQGDQLNADWGNPYWHLGFDQGRVQIVDEGGAHSNVMQITYPAGVYGSNGSSAFLADVNFAMGLPTSYEELYISYDVKFHAGFEFVLGGKLPGLCGSDINSAPSTGCNTGGGYPTGYDGWSMRNMWRVNGALENYIYHSGQESYYGDSKLWGTDATPGAWHNMVVRIVMNTVGSTNGILQTWLDGALVTSESNIEYRKVPTIGINLFYFSTFFGGNDASWAPSTDQHVSFDNFSISTDPLN